MASIYIFQMNIVKPAFKDTPERMPSETETYFLKLVAN